MKKTLLTLAAVVAIPVAAVSSALAGFGPGWDGERGGPHGAAHIERMARMLDLSAEQKEKMRTLFAEQDQKRTQMREAMRTDMQTRMQAILTPQQYARMADMRQMRAERMERGMGGCRGGDGPRGNR